MSCSLQMLPSAAPPPPPPTPFPRPKLRTLASPKAPAGVPFQRAPAACAASSMTQASYRAQSARTSSIGTANPKRCDTTTMLAPDSSAFVSEGRSGPSVDGLMSYGMAPSPAPCTAVATSMQPKPGIATTARRCAVDERRMRNADVALFVSASTGRPNAACSASRSSGIGLPPRVSNIRAAASRRSE